MKDNLSTLSLVNAMDVLRYAGINSGIQMCSGDMLEVWLGDKRLGRKEVEAFDISEDKGYVEAVKWLAKMAGKHYPNAPCWNYYGAA